MKIIRTVDGKDVEIELTCEEIAAARVETEKQAISRKLDVLHMNGLLAGKALHDDFLMEKLVEDMHFNIELNEMSESDAIDAAIERLVDLAD